MMNQYYSQLVNLCTNNMRLVVYIRLTIVAFVNLTRLRMTKLAQIRN